MLEKLDFVRILSRNLDKQEDIAFRRPTLYFAAQMIDFIKLSVWPFFKINDVYIS
jgi:hypothetical protein